MTTKPTHTTARRRHGVDGRRANDPAKRAQLERDLADALAQLDKPKRAVRVAAPVHRRHPDRAREVRRTAQAMGILGTVWCLDV